jgi:hypothetical protein
VITLNYPDFVFRRKIVSGVEYIFDEIRRSWIRITPEEWVRQNCIRYLIEVMNYPRTLIAIEKQIRLGEMIKRFDALVYKTADTPWMIVECKSPSVPLNQDVLQQALRYNLVIPVPFILITNGAAASCYHKTVDGLRPLDELPTFV